MGAEALSGAGGARPRRSGAGRAGSARAGTGRGGAGGASGAGGGAGRAGAGSGRAGAGLTKSGKPRPGTGGYGKHKLEGKGPTPPAAMRPGHPAQRRAAAAGGNESRDRRQGDDRGSSFSPAGPYVSSASFRSSGSSPAR